MADLPVYLETSVVSYLVARPSRNTVTAAHQQLTQQWWDTRAGSFRLFVSELVLSEASLGDPEYARRRLNLVADLPSLAVTPEVRRLASMLLATLSLPGRALADALHVAVATVHGMDYLLTWNVRHIANAGMRRQVERTCRNAGYSPPVLCTPEELLDEE